MKSAYQDTVEEVRNLKGIEEAIALAIEREKEAKDFYLQQAALMENPKFVITSYSIHYTKLYD